MTTLITALLTSAALAQDPADEVIVDQLECPRDVALHEQVFQDILIGVDGNDQACELTLGSGRIPHAFLDCRCPTSARPSTTFWVAWSEDESCAQSSTESDLVSSPPAQYFVDDPWLVPSRFAEKHQIPIPGDGATVTVPKGTDVHIESPRGAVMHVVMDPKTCWEEDVIIFERR
jgi:hypothetical protein